MAINLIIKKEELPRKKTIFQKIKSFFSFKPFVSYEDGRKIILEKKSDKKEFVVFDPKKHTREKEYSNYYEVDVSEKSLSIFLSLPSRDPVYDFQVSLRLTFKANDPIQIVKNNIKDLKLFIKEHIFSSLGNITEDYDYDKIFEVRKRTTQTIKRILFDMRCQYNMAINVVHLSVNLDKEYVNYKKKLKRIAHEKEITRETFLKDETKHYELRKILLDELTQLGPVGIFLDKYITSGNMEDAKELITAILTADLGACEKKIDLFEKAKSKGIAVGEIENFISEAFKHSELDKLMRDGNYSTANFR